MIIFYYLVMVLITGDITDYNFMVLVTGDITDYNFQLKSLLQPFPFRHMRDFYNWCSYGRNQVWK